MPKEMTLADRMLLESGFDLKKRSKKRKTDDKGDSRHGVGVYVIKDGKLLCGTRADNGKIGGPGGHVKDGETLLQAAIRETQEEFGITPKKLVWFGHLGRENGHSDSHMFLCTDWEGDLKTVDREMSKPRWASLEELQGEDLYDAFSEGTERLIKAVTRSDGNAGSGNWGHEGRPGKVGGSKPGGGKENRVSRATGEYTSKQREAKRKVVNGTDKTKTFTWDKDKYEYRIDAAVDSQGFNGLPKVVNSDDFASAVEESGFLGQRIYNASSKEILDSYRKALYDGEFYVNCSNGGSAYGQGMYAAGDFTGGERQDYLDSVSDDYSGWSGYNYIEQFTIDPSAKIADYSELNHELKEYKEGAAQAYVTTAVDEIASEYGDNSDAVRTYLMSQMGNDEQKPSKTEAFAAIDSLKDAGIIEEVSSYNGGLGKAFRRINAYKNEVDHIDVGTYAAISGYDMVRCPKYTGDGDNTSYVVVLNRTKLIFKSPSEKEDGMERTDDNGGEIKFKRAKDGRLEAWKNGKKIGTINDMGDDLKRNNKKEKK